MRFQLDVTERNHQLHAQHVFTAPSAKNSARQSEQECEVL